MPRNETLDGPISRSILVCDAHATAGKIEPRCIASLRITLVPNDTGRVNAEANLAGINRSNVDAACMFIARNGRF